MLREFIKAFFFIFVAEMGDKTQIIAMTCAAKYSIRQVLIGIFIGVLLNHGLAIIIGIYLSNYISIDILQIIAGFLFILFGLWTFINDDDSNNTEKCSRNGAILTVASAFFIGELGDKTQLTALTLSMNSDYPFFILLGAITGMLITGIIGIIVGNRIGKKVSGMTIKIISGIIFVLFGVLGVFSSVNYFVNNPSRQAIFIVILSIIVLFLISMNIKKKKR